MRFQLTSYLLLLLLLPALLSARPPRSLLPQPAGLYSPEQQLAEVLDDTSGFPLERVSDDGNFRVHYYSEGVNAATEAFVDSVCTIAETVLQVERDQLGFREAPWWADGMYHIYLQNLTGMFGYTEPTQAVSHTDPGGPQYSRIVLDNDYPPELFQLSSGEALQITLAHEYCHAIQLGMFDCTSQRWFMELTSTWMEDRVYGEIDDWFRYLPAYLNSLDHSMRQTDGQREYGMALWAHFLEQRFEHDELLRDSWDEAANSRGDLMSISLELAEVDPWELFTEFQIWNMLTGEFAHSDIGYAEAQLYPPAPVQSRLGSGFFETEELAVSALVVEQPVYGELQVTVGNAWLLNRRTGQNQSLCCGASVTTGLDREQVLLHAVAPGSGTAMAVTLTSQQELHTGAIALLNHFPNPALTDVTLQLYSLEPLQSVINLYDLLGRRLLTLPVSGEGGFNTALPLADLPAGHYFLELDGSYRRLVHLR